MCKPEAGMDRKTWAQQYIQSIRSGYIYSILSPKGYQIMAKTMLEICNYQVPNFNKRFNFVVTVKKKFLVVPWLPLGPLLVWWSLLPINVQGVIFFFSWNEYKTLHVTEGQAIILWGHGELLPGIDIFFSCKPSVQGHTTNILILEY